MGSFDWRRGAGGPVFSVEALRVFGLGPNDGLAFRPLLRMLSSDERSGMIRVLHEGYAAACARLHALGVEPALHRTVVNEGVVTELTDAYTVNNDASSHVVHGDDESDPTTADDTYVITPPDNTVTGPRTDVTAPNGIVLSPDENTLYVGDVQNKKIAKFTVDTEGVIGASGTPFATAMHDTVDGMCVDCAGNIYAGTQGAIEVYSSTGSYIGSIVTNLQTSNCTFGGADRKTIYMTTPAALKYVTLAVPGLPD